MSHTAPPEPSPVADPVPTPAAAPAPGAPLAWLSRWRPLHGAVVLAVGAALGAGLLALTFTELLAPYGAMAAPWAAALGMLVIMLPLAALLLKLARQLERQRVQLARVDAGDMTAWLAGRTQFIALAEREWARARRYGGGIAVLVIEVDRLRRLGEARGVAAAEALLHEMARHTVQTLRGGDALAQFGDHQLAVFLAHADPTGALDAAERIRERLEQLEVAWRGQPLRGTVSIGAATLRPDHANVSTLLDDAQLAALLARQAGGNCVRTPPVDAGRLQAPGSSVGDNQPAGPSF